MKRAAGPASRSARGWAKLFGTIYPKRITRGVITTTEIHAARSP